MELLAFGDTGWGDEMGRAMLMTLAVALTSMALGLGLGALEATAKLAGSGPARLAATLYTTEIFRGAAIAVPRGQIGAGQASGMSRWLIFRRILAPQALRFALPGLGNVWQLTLKDTSLIMVTGLVELMRQSYVAAGSSREPFLFYLAAAAIYLGLTSVSAAGFRRAEVWANRGTGPGTGRGAAR